MDQTALVEASLPFDADPNLVGAAVRKGSHQLPGPLGKRLRVQVVMPIAVGKTELASRGGGICGAGVNGRIGAGGARIFNRLKRMNARGHRNTATADMEFERDGAAEFE